MTSTVSEAMNDARAAAPEPIDRLLERMGDRIGSQANVKAVFGETIERDGVAVVPVARIRWGFGGGTGTGPTEGRGEGASGSGSGGGGGAFADPMGYLEVRPTGATYVPLAAPYLNPWLILASGVSIAFVLRALARLIRG